MSPTPAGENGANSSSSPAKLRFADYWLDLRSGELGTDGGKIYLQQQPLEVLRMLLERPGEMVSREELRQRLWPGDTFVDFDHGLNKVVQKLRTVLGDNAETPRFIETLPRRGYRFITAVEEMHPGIVEPVARISDQVLLPVAAGPARVGAWRRAIVVTLAVMALLAVGLAAGVLLKSRLDPGSSPSYQRLTFRRGLIRSARFAPDGKTIFYGALWDGGPSRIYTVRPESPESRPLELPEASVLAISSSGEMALALGSHLAGVFNYGTLARVPLAGGVPREILEDVKFADWSPDGTELAIVRHIAWQDRLEFPVGRVLVTSTGADMAGLGFPRISPGGDRVAFIEYEGGLRGHVAIVDRAGVKRVVSPEYVNIYGLAWRGDEIWFTAADEKPLFRALHAVRPGRTPRLVARVPGNLSLHDVTVDGRVLIAHTDDRHGITVVRPKHTQERDLSWMDGSVFADLSRDGQWILFTEFGMGGGPDFSIYLRRTDGSPAVRLGSGWALALSPDAKWALARPPWAASPYLDLIPTGAGETKRIQGPGLLYQSARWLPDGRVVVSAQEDGRQLRLYVLNLLERGKPRALTPEGVQEWSLSPDGKMVAAVVGGSGKITLYGIDTAESRVVSRVDDRTRLASWIEHGLLVTREDRSRPWLRAVFRVDPVTGREKLWREIMPSDPAGLMCVMCFVDLQVTADGRTYAYSSHRALSDLYLIDGLK